MEHGRLHTHGIVTKTHGAILTVVFSFLLPLGIILIGSGSKHGFRLHWIAQLIGMILAVGAMIVMVFRTWTNIAVSDALVLVEMALAKLDVI